MRYLGWDGCGESSRPELLAVSGSVQRGESEQVGVGLLCGAVLVRVVALLPREYH
jgi:hypothetical protein